MLSFFSRRRRLFSHASVRHFSRTHAFAPLRTGAARATALASRRSLDISVPHPADFAASLAPLFVFSWPIRDCCCCSAPACRLMPPARPAPAWLPRVYLPITRCRSVNIYHTLPCQRELSHSLSEPGGCVQSCPNLMPQSHLERRTDGTNHLGVASSPSAKAIWAITSAAKASTTLR